MILRKNICRLLLFVFLTATAVTAIAQDQKVSLTTGVDLYNRYVWRGLDIAATPSIQPTLAVGYAGFELGTWGAYTLSNGASGSDEIDFWLSYGMETSGGLSLTAVLTDYYFPNAGVDFFNFNDYDATTDAGNPDPGAHTIEAGLSVTGPESFPIAVSGYMNMYNDAGNNTYFQVDYPVMLNEIELGFFVGATSGSEDNADYYGTDDLQVINLGVSASRSLKVSESFTMPFNVSFVVNPNAEIAHLLVGISF